MDSRSFTERLARKMPPRFSCSTVFLRHRECSSLSSRGFPIDYHLVAPDYPGFGHSDWPDPKKFAYTFDHYRRSHESIHRSARSSALHACTCRITAGPSAFAWPWLTRNASRLSSFRTPWPTTKDSAPIGKRAAHSGPIVLPTKAPCAPIFYRLPTTRTRHRRQRSQHRAL